MNIIAPIRQKLAAIGPGMLVTSAFIGPGTVTVCSMAGYNFGYGLLWALLFSIIATIILQEMCARLGLITQKGLAELISHELKSKTAKISGSFLIISSVIIGNGAYEAGNITGAAIGWQVVFGNEMDSNFTLPIALIGILAFIVLFSGSYRIIEKVLITLVSTMSIVFIVTAIAAGPALMGVIKGLFIPKIPDQGILTVVGLIGTTIVPYNLFLHSASISSRWKTSAALSSVRFDTYFSIAIGGIVSMSIVICSAVASLSNPALEMSMTHLLGQLTPILGNWSKYFMAVGLFAAGISSAITAPLAAAYAASGIFGFDTQPGNKYFRLVSTGILFIGLTIALAGIKPLQLIQFAQFTNGLMLPTVAIFLLWIMNKSDLLGHHTNKLWQNMLAIMVVAITVILGAKSIISLW